MRHQLAALAALSILVACGGEPREGQETGDREAADVGVATVDGASLGTVVVAGTCSGAAQV
ncbi:MAG: hypothetical protein HKP01_05785, partial [Gemmatimonadetes bacterium]|nr:hypothetical protein [Gemmatimonadota bacterium]